VSAHGTTRDMLSAGTLARMMGMPSPTEEQAAVIEAPTAPMLVVAGAGSGKTETMASRVVWLIANGIVQPRQVLGLTFTRKASHELSERITGRLRTLESAMRSEGLPLPPGLGRGNGHGAGDELLGQRPAVATYNGFALDLVTEHALRVGLDAEFTMMSPSASWQLAYELVEASDDSLDVDASPATLTAALISMTSSLADHLVTPRRLGEELRAISHHLTSIPLQDEGRRRTTPKAVADVLRACETRIALLPLLERFEAERVERAALDFSDQVRLAARIAREVPEAGRLERELHPVVLLDEFQDTSVAQLRMLADLYGPGHATCAVGDPQQAIYGWRGASAASLDGFVQAFSGEGAPVLQRTLSTSWRNDEAPLAVANTIAAPLREASTTVTIPELRARPGAGQGAVWALETTDERAEARAIAGWILDRRGGSPELPDAGAVPAGEDGQDTPPSAAVLVRARKQIPPIVEALEETGLPVQVIGLGGLLNRPEVADVRALLACVDDPGRGDWLMRLLAGPRFRLGARDMAALGGWRDRMASRRRHRASGGDDRGGRGVDEADEISLIDAVDDLPPEEWADGTGRALTASARERLVDLQHILRRMRRRLSLPLPDLVWEAVRALGTDLALLETSGEQGHGPAGDREGPAPADPLAALESFRDYAAAFERTAQHPGLGPFLALLEVSEDREAGLAMTTQDQEPDPTAVTVVTMHSAKGLEWDLVAVAGLEEGTVPSYDLRRAKTTEDGTVRVPDSGWLGPLAEASLPSSLRGDADILPQLEWQQADTQVEAEGLVQDFRFAQGEESLREDRRLMYVAVTRARSALLLTSAAWRGTQARPRPRSRYLAQVLPLVPDPFHERQEVPESNPLERERMDASWPPSPGEAEQRRERAAQALAGSGPDPCARDPLTGDGAEDDALLEQTRRVVADLRAQRDALTVHSPVRLSASQIVARAQDPEAAARGMLQPLPRRPSASARRGTAFHSWLEQRFTAGTLLDLEDLTDLADLEEPWTGGDGPVDDTGDDAAALARMRESFEVSSWAGRTPLAVEEPVTLTIGQIAVRGIIDAVYSDPEDPDGVVIVDWKTGAPPTGARRRARALQLSVYRLAWHERTGIPLGRIRTVFFYVTAGKEDEVTRHPSRGRLEQMLVSGPDGPEDWTT
jgi:DNA helicase-2/ATP-dependent DNA helicase PcrA